MANLHCNEKSRIHVQLFPQLFATNGQTCQKTFLDFPKWNLKGNFEMAISALWNKNLSGELAERFVASSISYLSVNLSDIKGNDLQFQIAGCLPVV
jgi:hypothetical protein